MSKSALSQFAPLTLLVVQLAVSVLCLWIVIWWRRLPQASSVELLRVAWLGLLEPGLAYMLGLFGLAQVGAAQATLIQSAEGIMIVLVSAVVFRQRPSIRFLILSLLVALATLVAAVYVVLSGAIAGTADAIVIVAWQQSVALVFALFMLAARRIVDPAMSAPPTGLWPWLIAGGSGAVQYALAFTLYMMALRRIPANTAGAFLTLTPVFGLVGATLFLHETLSATQAMGAAATLYFVWRISREAMMTSG